MGSGGSGNQPEGPPGEKVQKAKREVKCMYKATREINLMVSGGSRIWPEGTPWWDGLQIKT